MLISYPVLPQDAVSDDEDVYLKNILNGFTLDSEGTYPVSTISTPTGRIHRWHGGIHMVGNGEPIRAIADGTVVAYRFAPACETYEGLGDYDTSFVLIHHQTETGENTKVEFYSLYMHLANRGNLNSDRYTQLPDWMKQAGPSTAVRKPNKKIWRKDVLGFAGKHYNREAWHFEIFATDVAFNAFWRDSLFKAEGHGSDDFFGDAHFVIPIEQSFRATHPHATPQGIPLSGGGHYSLDAGQDGVNQESLYVSVQLVKGQRIATTYTFDAHGKCKPLGLPVEQRDYEYELYRLATALYPDCPSTGYEWLRFGRVLGPDRTTQNENWQLIRYASDRVGYIDLAPDRIVKLSDADFPFWHGWEKRAQGKLVNPDDGVCGDESVIALMQSNSDSSRKQLHHLICEHPSEWDASDLATRYAAVREPDQPLHDDEKWAKFEEHVQKLAFWTEAGLPERRVWHFHPLQFIRHMRKCAWLSDKELRQLQPSHAVRSRTVHHHQESLWEAVAPMSHAPQGVPNRHRIRLNKMMRKYGIDTPKRKAAFFGNALQETTWFSTLEEGRGDAAWYAPWFGRGFLQLTNPENYCAYWGWRGRQIPESLKQELVAVYKHIQHQPAAARSNAMLQDANFPGLTRQMVDWRTQVSDASAPQKGVEDEFAPSDSAGFYWAINKMAHYADLDHDLERCVVTTDHGRKVYYRSTAFWQASAAVNLPGAISHTNYSGINGFDSRCCAYGVVLAVVSEIGFPSAEGPGRLPYPEGYTRREL